MEASRVASIRCQMMGNRALLPDHAYNLAVRTATMTFPASVASASGNRGAGRQLRCSRSRQRCCGDPAARLALRHDGMKSLNDRRRWGRTARQKNMSAHSLWPDLPLSAWSETCDTCVPQSAALAVGGCLIASLCTLRRTSPSCRSY